MRDLGFNFLESAKDVLLVDKVISRLQGLIDMIPQQIKDVYYAFRAPCLIIAIALLALMAFEGYKLFKMILYVASAASFGIAGYVFIGPFVSEKLAGTAPDFLVIDALVAVCCSLIAIFLTRCAYKLMIMILGGLFGFAFGYIYVWRVLKYFFTSLQFLNTPVAAYITGGLFGAIFVLIFLLFFKHVFMVGTSFGGLIFASVLMQKLIAPTADAKMKFCFILIGIAIAIFAVVHQYKEEEKATEIVFDY